MEVFHAMGSILIAWARTGIANIFVLIDVASEFPTNILSSPFSCKIEQNKGLSTEYQKYPFQSCVTHLQAENSPAKTISLYVFFLNFSQ